MNRRSFFKRTGYPDGTTTRNLQSGLTAYSGNWTSNEVRHLLKRTLFGAKKSDVDYFLSLSCNDSVNELLNTVAAVSPPVREYGLLTDATGSFDDPGVVVGQTWINDFNKLPDPGMRSLVNRARIESLRYWEI